MAAARSPHQIFASMNGITAGTIASATVCASRDRHVPAAMETFHSSSSASSSWWVNRVSSTGMISGSAIFAKFLDSISACSPYSAALDYLFSIFNT